MQAGYTWQLRYGNMKGDEILKLITISNQEDRILHQFMILQNIALM